MVDRRLSGGDVSRWYRISLYVDGAELGDMAQKARIQAPTTTSGYFVPKRTVMHAHRPAVAAAQGVYGTLNQVRC